MLLGIAIEGADYSNEARHSLELGEPLSTA